jgi:lactobin A/cerein 7B family class IIb bacteriocin
VDYLQNAVMLIIMKEVIEMENIKSRGFSELDERELQTVDGGVGILVVIAAAAAVVGLAWVSYQVGTGIGKTIYYLSH